MNIKRLFGHIFGNKSGLRGFAWLAVSYVCGTIIFIISKYALNHITPYNFLFWWYGAGLIYHSLYGITSESIALEAVDRKYYLLLGVYFVLDLSATYSFILALKMMDPSIVSFISQSQILFTLFLGYLFLREVLNKPEIGASVVIIAGLLVMTYNTGSAPPAGILLMLFANFAGSANLVIVRKIGGHVGTLTFARGRTVSLFIIFLCYNLFIAGGVVIPSLSLMAVILLGSFFGPFLNVLAIYKSLEDIPAGKLALFRSLQPIFVIAASWIFLQIIPGLRVLTGGFIMILGSVILAYFHMSHVIGVKRPLRTLR